MKECRRCHQMFSPSLKMKDQKSCSPCLAASKQRRKTRKAEKLAREEKQWLARKEKEARLQRKSDNRKPKFNYHSYLKSPEWKAKSMMCIERAGGKCEMCGSTSQLGSHHYNYATLGFERKCDLFCLCSLCHLEYHVAHPSNRLPRDNYHRDLRKAFVLRGIIKGRELLANPDLPKSYISDFLDY